MPVIRAVDSKGIHDIARNLDDISKHARAGKIRAQDMQGACFSISSFGGIGGAGFTPIVNSPEVAILGVARYVWQPVWDGTVFVPRLLLPVALSMIIVCLMG